MSDKDKYKAFCERQKDMPIFSKDWFLDAVCENKDWEVILFEKNEQVVASFPFHIKKSRSFYINSNPVLAKYLGPYIIPEYRNQKHLYKIYNYFIDNMPKSAYFNQSFYYDFNNCLPFYWKAYDASPKYSYVIDDLSDLNKVYHNFSADYKNKKIPKAQETVKILEDLDPDEFYRVNKLSIDRQKMEFPFSLAFFKRFDGILANHKARKIFYAVDEQNQVHSVLYLIWDGKRAYKLLKGDDPGLRNSGAGILITWHAIQYTKNVLDLNTFDFAGSMIKPIELVRRQFGAKQEMYLNLEKYGSKLYHILKVIKN